MDTARTIRIVIDANAAKAGAAQANAALASIGNSARGANDNLATADAGMRRFSNSIRGANDNIVRGNSSLLMMARSLGRATVAMAGLTALTSGVTALAMALTGAADKAGQIEARLRNATKSTQAYAAANADVRRIANQTRNDLVAVTTLYSKMAKNADTLKLSTAGVGIATRSFSMALKVGGATAQEAEASILQLGQAMGSGVLNGDEFKSLAENADVFIKMLAQSMGVPQAALKKLGAEGKITGEQIAKALTDPKIVAGIEAQFGRIPVSFADVRTAIGNTLIEIAGALKEGLGIDSSLAVMVAQIQTFATNARPIFVQLGQQIRQVFATIAPVFQTAFAVLGPVLGMVANNLGNIVKVGFAVAAGFGAIKAVELAGSMIATATNVAKLGAFMTGTTGVTALFAGAMTMARTAVNGLTVAIAANPIGLIVTALTVGIALLFQFRDAIKMNSGEVGTLGDYARVVFSDIGKFLKNVADVGRAVFASVAAFFRQHLSPVVSFAKKIFGDVNVSIFGVLQVVATVVGGVVGHFIGMGNMARSIFMSAVTAVAAGVVGIANAAITGVQQMINGAITGINGLIAMADALPLVEIGYRLSPVALPKIAGPKMPTLGGAASDAASAYMDGQRTGQAGRRYVDGLRGRGNAVGREREARAGSNQPPANDNSFSNSNSNTTSNGSGGDGSKGADNAERQADAIRDYWQGLEQARDAAGLLGGELERHNAVLEYRKILGDGDLANARALTAEETNRINTLLQETATRKALADLNQQNTDLARQGNMLTQEGVLLGTMSADRAREEMGVRNTMGELRARLARENASLTNAELDAAVALHETLIRQNIERERANRLTAERQREGARLLEGYERERDPAGYAARQRAERDAAIRSTVARDGETPEQLNARIRAGLVDSAEEFSDDLKDISKQFHDRMTNAITQIGDAIGGEWGAAINKVGQAIAAMAAMARGDNSQGGILGGIAELFGKNRNGELNDFGKSFAEGTKNVMSFGREQSAAGYNNLKNLLSGKGEFVKSLGSVMGSAAGGLQIGSIVGSVGKMLNKNFSEKGSQIGGMIGSFIPIPGGSIIGSIAGGILGGIFGNKKRYAASSNITMGANGLMATTTGNNQGLQGEAGQASASVIEGINAIAARLGVDATGTANVSIGKYKHLWKVSESGGQVGRKHGIDFGEDREAAIKYAIQNAIQDGVLVGLSSFSDRLLKSAPNLDSALGLAESYEKLLRELRDLKDPLGGSVKAITDGLDKMVKSMIAAGATSDELAKVEEYRRLKLDDILKEQLSGFNDFKRSLFGEGTGVSAMNRLLAAQNEFGGMQAVIAGGGTVNQDEFTRVGQDVLGLAREVYGTSSSQFQAIRQALIAATDGAITNVTKTFNDATVVAINQQTDAANQNAAITNDLLRQQNELLRRIAGGGGYSANDGMVVNGRYIGAAL